MPERDGHSGIKMANCIGPAALTATTNGASIDMSQDNGYESIEYVVHVGTALVGGGFTASLEESDTGAFSGEETAVAAADTLGALPVLVATDTNKVLRVGSIGKKKFQRIVLTETGTVTGGVVGVSAILGHAVSKPVADQST